MRELTGGLTILHPTKGQWVSPENEIFIERMIPVRIACDYDTIEKIADMTLSYYDQEAVMYYLVSETVVIKYGRSN